MATVITTSSGRTAYADDVVPIAQGGYATLTAENSSGDLEFGISFALPAGLFLRPYVRAPLTDTGVVRVDGHAQTAKVGLALHYGLDWTGESGPATFLVLGGQAELGTDVYDYDPPSADSSTEVRRQSFSAQADTRYGYLQSTWQIAPQLSIAYDRSYIAQNATAVVMPGSNGGDPVVVMKVLGPPTTAPSATLRIGTPLYVGALGAPIGFGGYLVLKRYGATNAYQPWGEGSVTRGELWTYLAVNKPVNTRVGLAFFAESSQPPGEASATAYGVFVQLKLNTTLLEY